MITRAKFTIVNLAAAAMLIGGTAAAQQPQPNNTTVTPPAGRNRQTREMRMRHRGRRGVGRALQQLNLSDQQRQQMRSIAQSQIQSTQTQRQELRQLAQKRRTGTLTDAEMTRAKELRQHVMQSRQGVRAQMLTVLTPEQKAKLEELKKTREANRQRVRPPRQRII
jgi:protein CpxP